MTGAADSSDRADWLRLCSIPGVGPERQRMLLAAFGLPSHIFSAKRSALAAVVGEQLADQVLQHDSRAGVELALAWLSEPGNALISLADPEYPPALLETADPPCLFYAKGDLSLLKRPALAMVGARNATAQGLSDAEAFAKSFSQSGLTVVSGLALGIDAAAHRGALQGPGSTIAVIGTGIDRIYPARNAALARQIAEKGLVLSEFPLGTQPLAHNFPRRNRIISGLSRGVLVVEAAVGSGSLITARLAGEQGREVLAMPGSIHSPLARGCHQLIKQGAKLVESAQDVLEELRLQPAGAIVTKQNVAPPHESLPVAAQSLPSARVLDALGFAPTDLETLAARSGLTPAALFAILTTLELDNQVASLPGGRFQRLTATS